MIKRKEWNNAKSARVFRNWMENGIVAVDCDNDYKDIRKDLLDRFDSVQEEIKTIKIKKDYMTDLLFGLELYGYFSVGKDGFTMEMAEDSDFWAYLSMTVIPDIVEKRWGDFKSNEGRFYSKKTRIWLGQIWWFIHYSYNDSAEETKRMLSQPGFTTDTIMQMVDRAGLRGVFVEVYREIIKQYSDYDRHLLDGKKITFDQLFENVMKLNTAKILVYEPPLFEGGVKGYVSELFVEAAARK